MNFLETHDQGLLEIMNRTIDWVGGSVAAVLVTASHTADRAADTQFSHVSANQASGAGGYAPVAVSGKSISLVSNKIRFNCSAISFGSNVTVAARYVFLIAGSHAALNASDRIIGHIKLSASGNVSSTNSVFSFTPAAEGLFELLRSALPA